MDGASTEHRDARIADFLSQSEWQSARPVALAGDASRRRYFRLVGGPSERRALLMDADPALGEDVRPFIAASTYLAAQGLRPPQIYDANEVSGFLILEDFGDDVFDRHCARLPHDEMGMYESATDVLAHLTNAPLLGGVRDYRDDMVSLALSPLRWYADPLSDLNLAEAEDECRTILQPLVESLRRRSATILRDFHAQNLIWMGGETGFARVGLLDFQDAMIGPPVYDLVSLVTDARRDVPHAVRQMCQERFLAQVPYDREEFLRDVAICSAQRNLRILMIFARLSLYFGKPEYVALIPRVWAHLWNDLSHPDLADLKQALDRCLPEPTSANLDELRARCGTVQTLQ